MKKILNITLYMSEIIYEIRSQCFIRGRVLSDGQPALGPSMLQMSEDELDANRMKRSVGVALKRVKGKLSPYLVDIEKQREELIGREFDFCYRFEEPKEDVELSSDNLLYEVPEDPEMMVLVMPENFNEAFADSLVESINQYMVDYAMAEWFKLILPSEAATYFQIAEADLSNIKSYAEKRIAPLRLSQRPF